MNILITGGAGFVPSSTAEKLLQKFKCKLVLVDNFLTGKKENLPLDENSTFIEADVNDYNQIKPIFDKYEFDYVLHYAAVVGVKRTLDNPILVLDDIQGMKNILELSKNSKVKRVFFSSSSEVYGEPVHLPQNEETTPLNSRLPYAVVKNVGESYFRSYQQEYGLNYTIFRFFNTYGPKQSPDFVMSKFINAALKDEDITIYGDGNQTRTFCYVDDNVDACIKIMFDEQYENDVFNIGNDKLTTINELAKTIIKLTGSKSKIKYLPPLPEGDMTRRQPDITKMKQVLDRDLMALEVGIQKVLDAWQKK